MKHLFILITVLIFQLTPAAATSNALVFLSDFGTEDGAVSAMKGVAFGVDPSIPIFDLTHEIPPYNIWEAAYRLKQTVSYWPAGTVFVCVVDPGVGTDRRSVVARTTSGHTFVTPDNGTLTLIADELGLTDLRLIDESENRLEGSRNSYTFHGRDVYAYTGARLASGKIKLAGVGPVLTPDTIVRLPYQAPELKGNTLNGTISILDPQYGNIWTNINNDLLLAAGFSIGDLLQVDISHNNTVVFSRVIPFVHSFGDVPAGEVLLYLNSLMNVSLALNQDNMATSFAIESGADWKISLKPAR